MNKHAYLIMIHENTLVLDRLLRLIDDEMNDIYIHIDRKSKDVDQKEIKKIVNHSKIYFVKRHSVFWGTNSIVKAEIELFKKASKQEYAYYHLISGADLPIKTQQEIHEFFELNNGKEFIHFGTQQYQNDIQERYSRYHFFTKQLGRKRDKKLWVQLETYSLALQRRLKIDRRQKIEYKYFGGNWCSVTHDFVICMLKDYKKLRVHLWFTQISDETLYQTIAMKNPHIMKRLFITDFSDNYMANVRLIDWKRGNPYVFCEKDFEELINSSCMFARKFDEKTDVNIINLIYERLKKYNIPYQVDTTS